MALPLFFNAAKAAYDIEIINNSEQNKPTSKIRRYLKTTLQRIMNLFIVACILLATAFIAAPTAMAVDNPAGDAAKQLVCNVGAIGMHQKAMPIEGFGPSLEGLDPSKHKLTAYEKYGGLVGDVIVWVGPEKASNIEKGAYGAGQIRQLGGGEGSPIEDWGKNDPVKGDFATVKPGWYNTKGVCIADAQAYFVGVVNWSFNTSSWFLNAANMILSVAFEGGEATFAFLDPITDMMFKSLVDSIYADMFIAIVMISALILGYYGWVKKQSIEFVKRAFWLVGVAALSFAIFANPKFMPSVGTNIVSSVSTSGMKMVSTDLLADPSIGNLCDAEPVHIEGYDTARHEAFRELKCINWYYMLYVPFVNGQFGKTPITEDTDKVGTGSFEGGVQGIGSPLSDLSKPILLGNRPSTVKTWALYQQDNSIAWDGAPSETESNKALLDLAANQRYKDAPNMTWGSKDFTSFLSSGSVSLIGTFVFLVLACIFSFVKIFLIFAVDLAWMLAPLFLLIGMLPSDWGRRQLRTFAELWVGLYVRQIIVSILAIFSVMFVIAIMKSTASAPLLQVMMLIIGSAAAIMNWRFIVNTMGKISLGGDSQALGNLRNPLKEFGAMAAAGTASLAGSAVGSRAGSRPSGGRIRTTGESLAVGARKNKPKQSEVGSNEGGAGPRVKPSEDTASEHPAERDTSPKKEDVNAEPEAPVDTGAGQRPKRDAGLPDIDLSALGRTRSSHAVPKAFIAAWNARKAESLGDAAASGYSHGHAATADVAKHNARRKAALEQAQKRREKFAADRKPVGVMHKRTTKTKPVVDTRKKNRK